LPSEQIKEVAVGGKHIVVLTEYGKKKQTNINAQTNKHKNININIGNVYTMGENSKLQLGYGSVDDTSPILKRVNLPEPISAVSASHDYSCALSETGRIWAWGSVTQNNHKQT